MFSKKKSTTNNKHFDKTTPPSIVLISKQLEYKYILVEDEH